MPEAQWRPEMSKKTIIVKKGNTNPTPAGPCPWFVDYAKEKPS